MSRKSELGASGSVQASYQERLPTTPVLDLHSVPIPSPLLLAFLSLPGPQGLAAPQDLAAGQEPAPSVGDAPPTYTLQTLVVTPTTEKRTILDVPYAVERVDQRRIEQLRTLPQALRDVPSVMVQETGPGQGSPFIRGFTGFRTLFLVDGIRLNNSIFREGPNQYAGTVDPLSLSGIEVVKGPSSVLYGSDAIGGTVNALTKDPTIWDRPIGGSIFGRVASGANYVHTRVELGGAIGGDTAWHLGGTLKDFRDMQAGDPSGTLPETGYDEWDGDFKVQHLVGERSTLTFGLQHVDIEDAPRTHRTVFAVPFAGSSVGSDLRHDFDQERTLGYLRWNTEGAQATDWSYQSTLSYHRQDEVRMRERTGGRVDHQGIDVGTLGAQFRASRTFDIGRLSTGIEWYHDDVDSFLNRFGDQTPADDIQGPVADDSRYDLAGVYAELARDVTESTTITGGVRFTYAAADANRVRDPVTDQQIAIDDSWSALTGSLRFTSKLLERDGATVALFGGVSQGFRAPGLSDLTRFDSARTNEFEVPSTGLEEERYLSYELGVKSESDDVSLQLAAYLTDGEDVIQRFPTGQTNSSGELEISKANVGSQTIGGLELGGAWRVAPDWTVFGNVAWQDGQEDSIVDPSGTTSRGVPSRLMPLMGQLGVRLAPADEPWSIEARWIHAEDADRLSLADERDDSRIPPGGTPGYDVFDIGVTIRASDAFRFSLAVENIGNEDYRVHGSGLNRPGRNVVASASWSF